MLDPIVKTEFHELAVKLQTTIGSKNLLISKFVEPVLQPLKHGFGCEKFQPHHHWIAAETIHYKKVMAVTYLEKVDQNLCHGFLGHWL